MATSRASTKERTTPARFIGTRTTGSRKTYRFRASTANVARDGMIIEPSAWRLDNYRRNPVVLIAHDTHALPIGRAVNVTPDDSGLVAEIEFDTDDPRGREVERKVATGFLNALSVAWTTHRIEYPQRQGDPPRVTDAELLEISVVAVGSDAGALALRSLRRRRGKSLAREAAALLRQAKTPREVKQVERLIVMALTVDIQAMELNHLQATEIARLQKRRQMECIARSVLQEMTGRR